MESADLHDGEQRGRVDRSLVELVAKVLLHSIGGVRHVVLALQHLREKLHKPTPTPITRRQLPALLSAATRITGWRVGAMVGRRTCDQEVASSIPGRARLRNESGQVVHTQLPRR